MFEARDGSVTSVSPIRRRLPVEAYLSRQRRYAHLFGDPPRDDVIARIQAQADRNIDRYGLVGTAGPADAVGPDDGPPVRHHARRRVQPCEPDRLVAGRAPRLRPTGSPRATAPARPARTSRGWLYHAESGDYETAWRLLVESNPLPAVMGRICFHPCETSCNRAQLDEAVGINAVERFLGDLALERGVGPARTRLRPPAPGSWWSGPGRPGWVRPTTCVAWVTPCTSSTAPRRPGGMMRYGIPAYRLPRDVLGAEIERIVDLGVELELGRTVTDVHAERDAGSYDAVFLAVGAQLARRIDIPAGDSSRVVDALALLHGVADGDPPRLGRRVVVYGGGDTAVDAARTARRLGATDAVIVYRRTRARMPAHPEELEAALAEGVTVRWLSTVDQLLGPPHDRRADGVRRGRVAPPDRGVRGARRRRTGAGHRPGHRSLPPR